MEHFGTGEMGKFQPTLTKRPGFSSECAAEAVGRYDRDDHGQLATAGIVLRTGCIVEASSILLTAFFR